MIDSNSNERKKDGILLRHVLQDVEIGRKW